jgi:hypothetical protein
MQTSFYIALMLLLSQTGSFAIEDRDRHGFGELAPIHVDVDGDGKTDAIQPRTYTLRASRAESRKQSGARQVHWITFDLKLASGTRRASFFTYRYGDDRADYWTWALKPAGDVNRDGKMDLLFYSGDDTTDETVVLLQDATRFTGSSTGLILCDVCVIDRDLNVVELEQYDTTAGRTIPSRILARWIPHRGYFEGSGLYWVRAGSVALREAPSAAAPVVTWFNKDDAVPAAFENGRPVVKGKWVKVSTNEGHGWLDRGSLATSSRFVRP